MSPRRFVVISLVVAVLAWAGLAGLVYLLDPTPVLIPAAAVLAVLAVAATTSPLWLRVQQRLTPGLPAGRLPGVALRQGLWSGLFVAAVLLLRVYHLLDWVLAMVLLALFVMLEAFLQQRSQWRQLKEEKRGRGREGGRGR